jgi:ABC-type histidine transport system ATPase subunit
MLKVNNLHKSYGDNHVLRGIELSVNEGEFVVKRSLKFAKLWE